MKTPISFISAAITAFILAITAGTVYAYKTLAASPSTSQSQSSHSSATTQLVASSSTSSEAPDVSPQDAASVAAKFLSRTDLYSAELAEYQGAQSYKITFTSGDIVYVSMKGIVVGSELPPTPVPMVITQWSGGSGGGHHWSGGSGSGDSSEGGAEHESSDDGH